MVVAPSYVYFPGVGLMELGPGGLVFLVLLGRLGSSGLYLICVLDLLSNCELKIFFSFLSLVFFPYVFYRCRVGCLLPGVQVSPSFRGRLGSFWALRWRWLLGSGGFMREGSLGDGASGQCFSLSSFLRWFLRLFFSLHWFCLRG